MSTNEQVVYKLKHKGTGLFFEPQQWRGNVSVIGKVYSNKKPPRQSFIHIPNDVVFEGDFDVTKLPKYRRSNAYKTELDDWEVEEYNLIKKGKK